MKTLHLLTRVRRRLTRSDLLKNAAMRLAFTLATFGIGPKQQNGNAVMDDFLARCRTMDKPRVLELGTKRWDPDRSSRRDGWIPNADEYLGSDIENGVGVDIVADVHQLTEVVGEEQFDVIISCSTFEHFKYPHLAAHQVMKALKIGGILFVHTHQTFPLHSYPYDYFRFSREAMAGLFGTKMGFKVIAIDYEHPARIYAPHDPLASKSAAFLYVCLYGEKIGETPKDYIYEYNV